MFHSNETLNMTDTTRCITLRIIPKPMLKLNVLPNSPVVKPSVRKRITKYTLEIFLERAYIIHGNKHDYSSITKEHIKGRSSRVPIKCNTCAHEWTPDIHSHITHKSGCPVCAGNARWTLQKFLIRAKELHGDTVDYSEVTEGHIKNAESPLPLRCTWCSHRWSPNIHGHIGHKTGCPACVGLAPWTLERFLVRATKVHANECDYTALTEDHFKGSYSNIPITCKKCNHKWEPTIDTHIKGRGCPRCKSSTGEKACIVILEKMGIKYETQAKINSLPTRCFDFEFDYQGRKWLLEFDGRQHFEMIHFFHHTTERFLDMQKVDIMKTQVAVDEGYCIIRIDYTQVENIEYHLNSAFNSTQSVYFSTPEMYKYYT